MLLDLAPVLDGDHRGVEVAFQQAYGVDDHLRHAALGVEWRGGHAKHAGARLLGQRVVELVHDEVVGVLFKCVVRLVKDEQRHLVHL